MLEQILAIAYRVSIETRNKTLLDLVSGPKRLILAIRNVILRVDDVTRV